MLPDTDVPANSNSMGDEKCKESASSVEEEDGDASENPTLSNKGKPPLNVSVVRHSNSSALLAELVRHFLTEFLFYFIDLWILYKISF